MTNTELLKDEINNSGLKKQAIARKMELSSYGLQKKINNTTEFKASEIMKLCTILGLEREKKEEIFFASCVDLKSTN